MKNKIFIPIICLIISLSFLYHSSTFSPILNSDDAVVVLMIHNFHLPQDLYYWEANRFGSLIPLIGQIFYKILHIAPITSESIAHYLILVLGFLGFASLFKSKLTKIIFAIIWFLPPLRMIDILKLSQGEQYSVIGIAIFFINKLYIKPIKVYRYKQNLILLSITILFIISVWVSDLGVITIFIILIIHLIKHFKKYKISLYNIFIRQPELYYIIFGIISCGLFLYYAKSHSFKQDNYYVFYNFKNIIDSFKLFNGSVIDLLLFKAKEPFTSCYLYLIFILLILVLIKYHKVNLAESQYKWIIIFILDIILVFIIIISSKWAYLNGAPRRYFVCNYISFWIVFLLIIENFKDLKFSKFLYILILFTVILGGFGTIYNFKFIWPKELKPKLETVREFESLGKIGIISEYWNSYIASVSKPCNIFATPHDKSMVRKQTIVDSVFAQPCLYIIRDMWMDSFPDTLEQFGYALVRNGKPFRLGDCDICKYTKIKLNKTILLDRFKYDKSLTKIDKTIERNILFVPADSASYKNKYCIAGPYMTLGIGEYTVKFHLKINNIKVEDIFAILDVTTDWGTNQLASKKLTKYDFKEDKYQYIEVDFKTNKRSTNTEFKIFFLGNADLYFDNVVINEK